MNLRIRSSSALSRGTGLWRIDSSGVVVFGSGTSAGESVIALVLMAFKWLSDRMTDSPAEVPEPKTTTPDESMRQRPVPRESAEEERMRKFMEALGVPPDAARPIPARENPVLRPVPERTAPARPPELRPIPPIVAQPAFPRRHGNRPPKLPVPAPPRERSLDEAEAPAIPVEQIHLPPLQTPEVPSLETVSSVVTAIPFEPVVAESSDLPAAQSTVLAEARSLLRSPRAMRSAILLCEILGPPRGLQTAVESHTFPSR